MSIKIMSQVWARSPYRGERLLVMLALADWANDDGYCWPSHRQIAHKARITEEATKNIIHFFVSEGILEVVEEGRGRGHTTHYQIQIEKLETPYREKGDSETPFSEKGNSNLRKGDSRTEEKGGSERCAYKELTVMDPLKENRHARARARGNIPFGKKAETQKPRRFVKPPPPERETTPEEFATIIQVYEQMGMGDHQVCKQAREALAALGSDHEAA